MVTDGQRQRFVNVCGFECSVLDGIALLFRGFELGSRTTVKAAAGDLPSGQELEMEVNLQRGFPFTEYHKKDLRIAK